MIPSNSFAPVGSFHHNAALANRGSSTKYHLLLAHEVLEHEYWYQDHYSKAFHSDAFVILDNSLVELGQALPASDLLTAARVCNASCIVLPDKFKNMPETILASYRAVSDLKEFPLMGVVQGENYSHAVLCAEMLAKVPEIKYLAVPRVMVSQFGTREAIVRDALAFSRPVHLLGFSDKINDDLNCASFDGVMGIDSAMPIWFQDKFQRVVDNGIAGFLDPVFKTVKRPQGYLDFTAHAADGGSSFDKAYPYAEDNIKWVQQQIDCYKDVHYGSERKAFSQG